MNFGSGVRIRTFKVIGTGIVTKIQFNSGTIFGICNGSVLVVVLALLLSRLLVLVLIKISLCLI